MKPRDSIRAALVMIAVVAASALLAAPAPSDPSLSVLYPGSTAAVVDQGLAPGFAKASGSTIQGQPESSLVAAQMIRDGKQKPDVFISTDGSINGAMLMTPHNPSRVKWYATLASSELVLAYSPQSKSAGRFRDAGDGKGNWVEALQASGVRFGRADPSLDPLGYRTLFLFGLASNYYKMPQLNKFLGDAQNPQQVCRETELTERLQSDKLDAAVLYKFEALAHKLPFLPLPPEINLGSEKFAKQYAQQSYTAQGGVHIGGAPIVLTAAVPDGAANPEIAAKFVDFAVRSDDVWKEYGFGVVHHSITGNPAYIPQELSRFIMVSHPNEPRHAMMEHH